MDNIPLIALWVAVALLVIPVLSLWFSRRAKHHTQIVAFEERKQEVREIFCEALLAVGKSTDELNRWISRAILMEEDLLIVEKISVELKRKLLESVKVVRDKVAEIAVIRHEYETALRELDQIPASPSTQEHLNLVQLYGRAIEVKNKEQALLKEVRDTTQALEDTIKEIRARHTLRKSGRDTLPNKTA